MQFIKHQILDLDDIVYTMIPSANFRSEDILQAIGLLISNTKQCGNSTRMRYLIEISPDRSHTLIGVSDSIQNNSASARLWYQKKVHLENAVKTRYEGSFAKVSNGISKLSEYLREQNLKPATAFYTVVHTHIRTEEEIQNSISDIYIGIDKNVVLSQYYKT